MHKFSKVKFLVPNNSIILVVVLIVFVALQYPFLHADPDVNISFSRGANTDEGLYTCQIRNFINHNNVTLNKTDGIAKTPLFSAILYLPFKLFGTTQGVGRYATLFLSLLLFGFFFINRKSYLPFLFILIGVVFFQYHIFQFFHFCLAEILSTTFTALALFKLSFSKKDKIDQSDVFFSGLFITIAYFIKIQYLYLLPILPGVLLFYYLFKELSTRHFFRLLVLLFVVLFIGLVIYLLAWYLPNKQIVSYVLGTQTNSKIISLNQLKSHLAFMFDYLFLNKKLIAFLFVFILSYPVGIYLFFAQNKSWFKRSFIALTVWLVFESHKLLLTYFPTRYFISFYFAMGALISLVLYALVLAKNERKYAKYLKLLAYLSIVVLLCFNASTYYQSYKSRTFKIAEIDNYLADYDLSDKTIIGPWAPSLCWKSKALTYPVWKGYFNDTNIIESHNPAIIVSETDEACSDQAFINDGLDLQSLADSTKEFTINKWYLKLYWIGY